MWSMHSRDASLGARRAGRCHLWAAVAAALLALSATLPGCGRAIEEESYEHTFTVGRSPTLIARSAGGRIDISSGPPGVIVIQTTLQNAADNHYDVSREGDTITIESRRSQSIGALSFLARSAADIAVIAPDTTILDLRASKGHIEVDGLRVPETLRTSDGGTMLGDLRGALQARLTNRKVSAVR